VFTSQPDLFYISWVVVFLLVFLSQAIVLYTAYFRLEEMEAHFIASNFVSINRNVVGNGPRGRVNRAKLIGELTGTSSFVPMLDPYVFMEAEILPEHLKKWAKLPRCIMRIALAVAALLLLWSSFVWLRVTISTPASDLKILCNGLLISCAVIGLMAFLVRVWISLFKLNELESFLTESYFVARNRRVLGNSLHGCYSRLSHISSMLLFDDDFLSKSDPYAMDEIARFPLSLRRLVTIPNRMLAYSIVGFFVVLLCVNFFGIIE